MQDDSITAEQRAEIDAFLADDSTLRFIDSSENWGAISSFLDGHSLSVTHWNLVFAYGCLMRDGVLDLIPFQQPVEIPQPPAPVPSPISPVPAPQAQSRTLLMYRNGQPIDGAVRSL